MRTAFILIAILKSQVGFCQSVDSINSMAFEFYSSKQQFDSAIYYYKTLQSLYPDYRTAYITYRIGMSLLKNEDTLQAKEYLSKSLLTSEPLEYESCDACGKIGDIYFAQHNYSSALKYYDSITIKYSGFPYDPCQYKGLTIKFLKSLCLDKLGYTDSAISILTPYMFEAEGYRTLNYEKMVDAFIAMLRKVYPDSKIKNELKAGLKGIVYKIDNSPRAGEKDVECFMNFFSKKVILVGAGISKTIPGAEIPSFFQKPFAIRQLKSSPAYKSIMSL